MIRIELHKLDAIMKRYDWRPKGFVRILCNQGKMLNQFQWPDDQRSTGFIQGMYMRHNLWLTPAMIELMDEVDVSVVALLS